MLDQNTDRMWYVIGAVIVGAALIFLMNGTFPTLFANVGETFEEKVRQTEMIVKDIVPGEMTDGIKPPVKLVNLIDLETMEVAYDQQPFRETGELMDNPERWWYTTIGPITVEGGGTYAFTATGNMAAPQISYYDADMTFLGYEVHSHQPSTGVTVTLPENAAFVRLSSGDKRIKPEQDVVTIDQWLLYRVQ